MRLALLLILLTGTNAMAPQAETPRLVEQMLMMGEDDAVRTLRMSPVGPDRPLNPQPPLPPEAVRVFDAYDGRR